MKLFAAVLGAIIAARAAAQTNPIQKAIQLLADLETKIIKEGETSHKVYVDFAEFCEDRSRELHFEIKTENNQISDLKASIAEETATMGALTSKIEGLAAEASLDEADLAAARHIRSVEQTAFAASEKELMEIIDTLGRAVGIIEKEMAKGGASMMQLKSATSVAQALRVLVQASMLSTADASRLTALVQSSQESTDGDEAINAPDPAVYKSHSGDILETLQGLFEKAEAQLADLRKTETTNLHNFQLMQQSIEDEIAYGKKELAEGKAGLAAASEKKVTAAGDLEMTSKDLAADTKELGDLHQECLTKATDFEDEMKSRGEELKALAEAKKVLKDMTGGAETQAYGLNQVSFVQLARSKIATRADLANFEAVQIVRDLARKHKSSALAQLAARMSNAMSSSVREGEDPFAKVKGLIRDMIEKLEIEARAEASLKAYCDQEQSESANKKAAKEAEIAKLTTRIDVASARSASLKEQVAQLEKELSALATAQAEMDKLRAEEKAAFEVAKADYELGIEGVKLALKVLTEYYAREEKAHKAAEGAGAGIIGLLEVVESDFTKGLAEAIATEESAAAAYDAQTKENEIIATTKNQDVKYKTKEFKFLDKAVSEMSSDRSSVQEELSAVNEYIKHLNDRCFPLPAESYEVRVARREAEIAGLKDALKILSGEAVLLQKTKHHSLRHWK